MKIKNVPRIAVLSLTMLLSAEIASAQQHVNFTVLQPAAPVSQFSYSANGLTYSFTDLSTGSGIAWSWDFGDGGVSAVQNPSHGYAVDGTYIVCLEVTDAYNCTNTHCDTIVAVGVGASLPVSGLSVAPNPFTHQTGIEFTTDHDVYVVIELRNLLGTRVELVYEDLLTTGYHKFRTKPGLPAGVYFLSIELEGQRMTRAIVCNR
jgi:PKD repeat protein